MPYLIYTAAVWTAVCLLAGRRIFVLWKAGLVGVALQVLADYFGTRHNLYQYTEGMLYLGRLPLLHIVNVYAATMLFLNWLPRRWNNRILYIICSSAVFLAVEAVMHKAGGITYPNWKIWYSFFLLVAGLGLTAYIAELLKLLPSAGDKNKP